MQEMNRLHLFEGITDIDPQWVEEAKEPLKRKPAHIIWQKKVGALAASFLFMAGALLFVNTAFPAFAESLPLVGGAFQYLNSLGSHAPSYEGVVQNIGKSAGNNQYEVTVTEAYCDGEYIFFVLHLQVKDTKLLKMESLYTDEFVEGHDVPGWNITLNGESAGLRYNLPNFVRKGACFESEPIRVALPDGLDQSAGIHVEAVLGNLSGRTQEAADQGDAGQIVSIEPVYLQFDLMANTSYNQQKAVQNAVADGLELQSWSCSPSKLSVTLAYPYFDMAGVSANARTEDGVDLGEDLRESGDLGSGQYDFGDTAVQECTFIGPPEGTKKVIVTVYAESRWERNPDTAVFGEFTVDLETGGVTVTTEYLEKGLEHLSIEKYAEERMGEKRAAGKASASPLPNH